MSFFQNNPKAEVQRSYVHAALNTRQRESIRVTSLGFCLRVIVKETP